MTPNEYWNLYLQLETGTMPPADARKYAITGTFCESAAREGGSSLLPFDMPERDLPVEQIPERLLAVIGINSLAIASTPSMQEVSR